MTGKVANLSNFPGGFERGVSVRDHTIALAHPGKVFYVAGNATGNTVAAFPNRKSASDSNKGTFLQPFASLNQAIENCVNDRGDIIYVLPGSLEDVESEVVVDVSDLTILGLGQGVNRPQLTDGCTDTAVDVEADDVYIANLYFNEATVEDADGHRITLNGKNNVVQWCHFDAGAHDENVVGIETAVTDAAVEYCTFVVTANGPDAFIDIAAAAVRPRFYENVFVADDGTNALDDASPIQMNGNAVVEPHIKNNTLFNRAGGVSYAPAGAGSAVGMKVELGDNFRVGDRRMSIKNDLVHDSEDAVAETDVGGVIIHNMVAIVEGVAELGVESVFDDITTTSHGSWYGVAQELAIEDAAAETGDKIVLGAGGSTSAATIAAETDVEDAKGRDWYIGAGDNIVWDGSGATTADGVAHLVITYTSVDGGELEIE